MTKSRNRVAALLAAALMPLSVVAAAPAAAQTMDCHVLVAGPTPSAEVDIDNDGNPEVRVPSVRDVTLCVTANVVLTDSPDFWSEPCGEWGSCMRFFVHYGLAGYGEAQAKFCYTVDGSQVCGTTRLIRIPLDFMQGGTICAGYDLGGGPVCTGGIIGVE